MKLLVICSGMMGSAAAFDMASQPTVDSVTLADSNVRVARDVGARVNRITREKKVRVVSLQEKDAARLMKGHDGALGVSAVECIV
jgi:saccharopine dehydrogenase-like NADP-dependent oxidoreductase